MPSKSAARHAEGLGASLNVAVLRGHLSRDPSERTLQSGARLLALDVTVPQPDGPDETVPVAWFDPPDRAASFRAGDQVLVVGRVRRRFFRAAGATASRTEVVAKTVLVASRSGTARRRVEAVAAELVAAFGSP